MWHIYSVCAGSFPAGSASFADVIIVVYIVLYGYFDAYPIIFGQHGISGGKGGLMFVPVMIGFLILLGINFIHFERYKGLAEDAKKGIERRGIHEGRVEPEERLVPRKYPQQCSRPCLRDRQSWVVPSFSQQECSGLLGPLVFTLTSGFP